MYNGGYTLPHAPRWVYSPSCTTVGIPSFPVCTTVGIPPSLCVQRWVYCSLLTMVGILLPAQHGGYSSFCTTVSIPPSAQRWVFPPAHTCGYSLLLTPVGIPLPWLTLVGVPLPVGLTRVGVPLPVLLRVFPPVSSQVVGILPCYQPGWWVFSLLPTRMSTVHILLGVD